MPAVAVIATAAAGGAGATAAKPTLSYAGSYLTDAGKWTISNYDSGVVYTTGGSLSRSTNEVTISSTTASGTIYAKAPKGLTASATTTAYRRGPDQTNVPYTQCNNPCGNCNTSVNPHTWTCGCGSGCDDAGGGQWGSCICRGPGYNYWNNYGTSGYTWSGGSYTSDGSNGVWHKWA